jgi:hypothetical protein
MAEILKQGSANNGPINLDVIGKNLNISSIGKEMRLLECPKCQRLYIRGKAENIKYALCVCGVRIQLKPRWYD